MSLKQIIFLITCLTASYTFSFAQSTFIPLHDRDYRTIDQISIKSDSLAYIHTSVKPYVRLDAVLFAELADDINARFTRTDRQNQYHLYKDNNEWTDWGLIEGKKPFMKHFYKYKSDFFYVKDYDEFLLKVNPVLHLELGKSFGEDGIKFINTRGIEIRGMVSEKLGFYGYLGENQAAYKTYVHNRTFQEWAVVGEGRFKIFNSRLGDDLFADAVDFFAPRGYITYQPIERIRVQFGHDKNFIGDGFRSLLLSDFSNAMLFLKVQTQVWRFHYQNLFTQLISQYDSRGADVLLDKKYAAIHHLSFNASKNLNFGIFESVVFDRPNGFELDYLNPLLFYRAIEFQLGSPDNVLLGADFKLNFAKKFSLYGQTVVDEFRFGELFSGDGWWANKLGFQLGLKYVNVLKIANLDAQIEFNTVNPYTYSHHGIANYSHYNQPLAHPLGANFREVLANVHYQANKNTFINLDVMYAQQGLDADSTNWGANILLDSNTHEQDFNNKLLQGINSSTFLADLTFSYMWKHNFFFDINYTFRHFKSDDLNYQKNTENYLGLGMRMNIARKKFLF